MSLSSTLPDALQLRRPILLGLAIANHLCHCPFYRGRRRFAACKKQILGEHNTTTTPLILALICADRLCQCSLAPFSALLSSLVPFPATHFPSPFPPVFLAPSPFGHFAASRSGRMGRGGRVARRGPTKIIRGMDPQEKCNYHRPSNEDAEGVFSIVSSSPPHHPVFTIVYVLPVHAEDAFMRACVASNVLTLSSIGLGTKQPSQKSVAPLSSTYLFLVQADLNLLFTKAANRDDEVCKGACVRRA
eukprot:Gb_32358 [translate_table: standard]